jgi:hypothetical protein
MFTHNEFIFIGIRELTLFVLLLIQPSLRSANA